MIGTFSSQTGRTDRTTGYQVLQKFFAGQTQDAVAGYSFPPSIEE